MHDIPHFPTVLSIDLAAIRHNVLFFRQRTTAKLLAVVKANAYGHDAVRISRFLEKEQLVDCLAVAYVKEGIELRESGVKLPIMVLHPQAMNLHFCIGHDLAPVIHHQGLLAQWIAAVHQKGNKAQPTHLKFNTGLNRLGFEQKEALSLIRMIRGMPLKIISVFSHLAASECGESVAAMESQIRQFEEIITVFKKYFKKTPMFHLSNTSGILNYPKAHFDMVRLGIGMYGFANDDLQTARLKLVAHLKTRITQIREVPENTPIGYNHTFYTQRVSKIATVAMGHADGFSRQHANRAVLYVHGHPCPVVGDVCMDMLMMDVTDVACKVGDEVVVFETQQQLLSLAAQRKTISYDVLVNMGNRVQRSPKSPY